MANHITAEKVDFEWIISKRVIDECLTAYFSVGKSKWCATFYPHGICKASDEGLVTIAISLDKSPSKIMAAPELRIINHLFPEKAAIRQTNPSVFLIKPFAPPRKCEFNNIIHLNELLEKSNGFFIDDTLKIAINLNVQMESAVDFMRTNFILNQKKLFDSGEYSDCILVCPDGEVKAIKFLLSSQSDVFRTMFQSYTKEAHTGRVEISDTSVSVIIKVVEFTLTGRVESFADVVEELFIAADKYNIVDLRNICMLELCETITIHNLSKRCLIAERYQVLCLASEITSFLWRNNCSISIETSELLLTAKVYGITKLEVQPCHSQGAIEKRCL